MPSFIDRTGKRFGRLTVLSISNRASRVPLRPTKWTCQCDCGGVVEVASGKLSSGHTQSCGCLHREALLAANTKHGQSVRSNGEKVTKEYNTWGLMMKRCSNKTSVDYPDYGGRGIFVCERWHTFENFFSDMGKAPTLKHSIDRRNNDGPYAPENCYWATQKEQARNKRNNSYLTAFGLTKSIVEWSEYTGIDVKLIHNRKRKPNWSAERVLTP